MRTAHSTLTRADVQTYAHQLLCRHLCLPDYSRRGTAQAVYAVLLFVAATAGTIARACRTLLRAPCDQTLDNALQETLPERHELLRRLHRALAATLPKAVTRGNGATPWPST